MQQGKVHMKLTQLLQHLVTLIQDKVLQVLQGKLLGPDQSKNPVQNFVTRFHCIYCRITRTQICIRMREN